MYIYLGTVSPTSTISSTNFRHIKDQYFQRLRQQQSQQQSMIKEQIFIDTQRDIMLLNSQRLPQRNKYFQNAALVNQQIYVQQRRSNSKNKKNCLLLSRNKSQQLKIPVYQQSNQQSSSNRFNRPVNLKNYRKAAKQLPVNKQPLVAVSQNQDFTSSSVEKIVPVPSRVSTESIQSRLSAYNNSRIKFLQSKPNLKRNNKFSKNTGNLGYIPNKLLSNCINKLMEQNQHKMSQKQKPKRLHIMREQAVKKDLNLQDQEPPQFQDFSSGGGSSSDGSEKNSGRLIHYTRKNSQMTLEQIQDKNNKIQFQVHRIYDQNTPKHAHPVNNKSLQNISQITPLKNQKQINSSKFLDKNQEINLLNSSSKIQSRKEEDQSHRNIIDQLTPFSSVSHSLLNPSLMTQSLNSPQHKPAIQQDNFSKTEIKLYASKNKDKKIYINDEGKQIYTEDYLEDLSDYSNKTSPRTRNKSLNRMNNSQSNTTLKFLASQKDSNATPVFTRSQHDLIVGYPSPIIAPMGGNTCNSSSSSSSNRLNHRLAAAVNANINSPIEQFKTIEEEDKEASEILYQIQLSSGKKNIIKKQSDVQNKQKKQNKKKKKTLVQKAKIIDESKKVKKIMLNKNQRFLQSKNKQTDSIAVKYSQSAKKLKYDKLQLSKAGFAPSKASNFTFTPTYFKGFSNMTDD